MLSLTIIHHRMDQLPSWVVELFDVVKDISLGFFFQPEMTISGQFCVPDVQPEIGPLRSAARGRLSH